MLFKAQRAETPFHCDAGVRTWGIGLSGLASDVFARFPGLPPWAIESGPVGAAPGILKKSSVQSRASSGSNQLKLAGLARSN
jgi:hypothetical protein